MKGGKQFFARSNVEYNISIYIFTELLYISFFYCWIIVADKTLTKEMNTFCSSNWDLFHHPEVTFI